MRQAVVRFVCAVQVVAGLIVAGALQAAPITDLFFFGDSLTDAGNAAIINAPAGADSFADPPARSPVPYPLVGADTFVYTPVYVPPWQRPYEGSGRFTDGFTWATAFASALGFPGAAAPSLDGGNNYAVGGASVVPFANPPVPPPSAVEQLAAFRMSHGGVTGTFDSTALYFIGLGGNDLRTILTGGVDPLAGAAGIVGGLSSMVTDLLSWGAQRIVLWNAPDITVSPQFQAAVQAGLISATQATEFLGLINQINALLGQLDALPGVDVFDLTGLLRSIVADPFAYGLVNASLPCGFADVFTATLGTCAQGFLFWDGVHPSSAGHAVLARSMIAFVPEPGTLLLVGLSFIGVLVARSRRGG